MQTHTFAIEKLATVLAGERYALGELSHQLNDLSNVIVIF